MLHQGYDGTFHAKDLERPDQIVCYPTDLSPFYEPMFLGWLDNHVVSCISDYNVREIVCSIFTEGKWDDLFTYKDDGSLYHEKTTIFQVDRKTMMFLGRDQIVFLNVATRETRVEIPDFQLLADSLAIRVNKTHLIITGGEDTQGHRTL